MSNLTVYKASAGSGKTFTLAVSYIELLLKNPQAYKTILAVTFTNKATAEMKERILSQLYGLWKQDPDSDAYLNVLIANTGYTADYIQKKSEEALLLMLHDYSRFRVETIDSFFQSIMRNLARELDLSPNLNIELNGREVLSEAVDSFIEKLQPGSILLSWLIDYIDEKISDNKRWDVSQEIKDFAVNILDENYIEKGKDLRLKLKDPKLIPSYRKALRDLESAALKQMQQFHDRFQSTLSDQGITIKDIKYGNRIESYFNKLNNGNLLEEVRNASVESFLSDPNEWVKKSSKQANIIASIATSTLIPLLKEAEEYRSKNNRIVNSCVLSLKHINKLQLLAHIDEEMRTLNNENNRFLLSDTNALLKDLIKEGDSSFIFEKIGSSIHNIMIDEFQDTSRMQWQNFKLLLTEGLSQGGNSLIVGDVKQSIYRWRNGDWSILNELGDTQTKFENFDIITKTLAINRRSESNVIHFNNALFPVLVQELSNQQKEELSKPCKELEQAYSDVEQHSPKEVDRGYAQIEFIQNESAEEYLTKTLSSLSETINHLVNDEQVRPHDIAILVRKKKNIPAIADHLTHSLGLTVVSDEAFRLDASIALNILIDALRYLSNPEDTIIEANLALTYQQNIIGNTQTADQLLLLPDIKELLPVPFVESIDLLRELPLYELLEKLFVYFELTKLEHQDAYLFSFFDKVIQYLETESSLLDEFVTYWDETMSSETIPSGEVDGIRILTIHKSKGLEFHTVLVPFCDWPIETDRHDQLLWCSPQLKPFNELDITPINYGSTMAESIYRKDYLHERLQLWVDNLNLLYVALTRAGSNLFLFCKSNDKRSISGLIETCLPSIAQHLNTTWDIESPFQYGNVCPSKDKTRKDSSNVFLAAALGTKVSMQSLPHDFKFKQSNRSKDFIAGIEEEESPTRFLSRGKLLHELFAEVRTLKDVEPAIKKLKFEGLIRSEEEEEQIRSVAQQAFEKPEVQAWYSNEWDLFTECEIIYTHNGIMESRRPDRVMVQGKKAIVVDFKFGKRQKTYIGQVREYMKLLTQMGYTPIEGYIWYVTIDQIESVK